MMSKYMLALAYAAGFAMNLCTSSPLHAQQTQLSQPLGTNRTADALTQRRQDRAAELRQIEGAIAISNETRLALQNEVEIIKSDRESLNAVLLEAAARAQVLEADLQAIETELQSLGAREDALRASLAERRFLLAQVLAALQRMGKNPPPALLIGPKDALQSVRSAILMGAVVPEMRDETNALLADLTELKDLKQRQGDQRTLFVASLKKIKAEEARIALLVEEKRNLENLVAQQLRDETARAEALARRANSVNELITALETEIAGVRTAQEAARQAEVDRLEQEERLLAEKEGSKRNAERERLASRALANTARLAPAIPFSQAKGRIVRPAAGVELKQFGERSAALDQTQGILMATRADATVVSPADGWVLYAGAYRSFGRLVILNVGDDHHIVMAGLDETHISLGQFVLAGEPIGRMGRTKLASAASLDIRSSRPTLYIEFRKDGQPIDPSPWWADTQRKGVSNDS